MPTTTDDRKPSRLRRLTAGLAQSKSELLAQTLQTKVRDLGTTPIADSMPGEEAVVSGVLRSVTLRPRDNVPAVEAELFDGSGRLFIVWLGRRRIPGITPGRSIVVQGRISRSETKPTVFNPRYTLRAPGSAP